MLGLGGTFEHSSGFQTWEQVNEPQVPEEGRQKGLGECAQPKTETLSRRLLEHMTIFQSVHSREQIADVVRLAREIWQEHYLPIIGQRQVDYMLENFQSEDAITRHIAQAYEYYLIAHDGLNAGYLAIVANGNDATLMLSKLYVRKAMRGHGLGKQGLQFVESVCRSRGVKLLWLTVNKNNADSIAWYSRMGFKNAGPIVQDIGGGFVMDDFRFEKTPGSASATT